MSNPAIEKWRKAGSSFSPPEKCKRGKHTNEHDEWFWECSCGAMSHSDKKGESLHKWKLHKMKNEEDQKLYEQRQTALFNDFIKEV